MGKNWVGPPPTRATDLATKGYVDTQTGDPTPEDFAATFNGLLTTPPSAGTASETAAGVTQFATAAEVRAGTVANHAVSPLQLAAWGVPVIPCADFGTLSAQVNAAPTGSLLTVQNYAVTSAISHVASLWLKGADGKARPVSPIFIGGGTSGDPVGQGKTNASTVLSYLVGYGNLAVPANTAIFDDFKNEFRLVSGSNVKCWNSDWASTSIGMQGFVGGYGASNGWISSNVGLRYRAGRVGLRGTIIVNGNGAINGQIDINLPVAADTTVAQVVAGITAWHGSGAGGLTDFPLWAFVSGSVCYTGVPNVAAGNAAASAPTGASVPFTWVQSDQIRFNFEYDPA